MKSKYPYCFKAAMSKEKASCLGGAKALKRQTEQERERERERPQNVDIIC